MSGVPLNKKVTNHEQHVINIQADLLEVMCDCQQGKMGFLSAS